MKKPRKKTYSNRYKPNVFFMKQLKDLDQRLGCRYREDLHRFVITWEKFWGMPDEIMVVNKPHFRQPDRRELLTLCGGDLHRTDMRTMLEEGAAYYQECLKRQDKTVEDDIRNATKDDKQQLSKAYRTIFNTGVKGDPFRKVVPKHKGKTLDELQGCIAV